MTQTFTLNELLLYVYNELADNEKALLETALRRDKNLAEACAELIIAKAQLEAIEKSPSEKTVNTILTYSRNLSLQL